MLTIVFRVEGSGFGDTTQFPRPKSGGNEALQPLAASAQTLLPRAHEKLYLDPQENEMMARNLQV